MTINRLNLSCAVLLVSFGVAISASPQAAQGQPTLAFVDRAVFARTDVYVMPWMDDGRPLALFVALHGFGSSADDFGPVGPDLAGLGVVAALPQAPHSFAIGDGRLGYSWTRRNAGDAELRERSRLQLINEQLPRLVAGLSERFSIDETYLVGFSQGARMALVAGLQHQDMFSGVITIGLSGFDPEWVPEAPPDPARRIPVWMAHGRADSATSLVATRTTADLLREKGYRVVHRLFDGGHEVPAAPLREAAIWMLRQQRP